MRVQLNYMASLASFLALFAMFFLFSTSSVAQTPDDNFAARLDVYNDENITVWNQSGSASIDSSDGSVAGAHYAVDAVSGATKAFAPDAISSATRFSETRVEMGVHGAVKPFRLTKTGGDFVVSLEPDYFTVAGGLSVETELFQRMSKLFARIGLSGEGIGEVSDPFVYEPMFTMSSDVTWSQILSRLTVVSVLTTGSLSFCGERIGCHASPYRYALMLDERTGARFALRERHPSFRARGATGVRISHSIAPGFAWHASYRFYLDSWWVSGHTADFSFVATFLEGRLQLRLSLRGSYQTAAEFFDEPYKTPDLAPPQHRTFDPELSELAGLSTGGAATYVLGPIGIIPRLTFTGKVTHLTYRYFDSRIRPRRDAWVLGVGVGMRL
ncbi:MAG: DUF3570 domain-containing protein [Deltaproteobacteria bacterium]|nr:DUF3570 domain-containing protein [Deltaproteobacteria bacterium]